MTLVASGLKAAGDGNYSKSLADFLQIKSPNLGLNIKFFHTFLGNNTQVILENLQSTEKDEGENLNHS